MATIFKVEFEGFKETNELFRQIEKDYGEKDSQKILRNAVRKSMQPVLLTAKALAPKDTGGLAASLQVETRKPSNKDKRSKYIDINDIVIGAVTTASGKKLSKKQFTNIKTNQKQTFETITKTVQGKEIISNDQRAAAMEFGTSKLAAKPYLRPALESSASNVVNSLGDSLRFSLEKYRAKQTKIRKKA